MSQVHNHWRQMKFGDVARFVNGYPFKPTDWKKKGLPIIRIQNLNDIGKDFNYFDGECDKRYLVRNGDILISWSASLGVYIWNRGNAVLNQHIFKVVPDEKIVDPDFFYYCAQTKLAEMSTRVHGSTMKHITKDPFLGLEILVPPITTQRKIVAILKNADTLRKKREQANQIAIKLLQAIFLQMFGEPETNTKKWKQSDFGSLITDMRYGTSVKCDSQGKGTPILRIPNIIKGKINYADMKYGTLNQDELGRLVLKEGDILFVRTNGNREYVGRSAVFHEGNTSFAFASYLIRARLSEKINPDFAKVYLSLPYARKQMFQTSRTSAGQYNINTQALKAIKFYVPPLNLQQQFAVLCKTITLLNEKQQKSTIEIDKLFDSLLSKTFKVELSQSFQQATIS